MPTFHNPIIPGFYPDPSICRVGDDYYLATSTFEYFPGVPVFHSRDLVNWRQIGHCLTRESQVPLAKCRPSAGIYAPTLRHRAGRFYMITTNVSGGGVFYVHADDPAGEWSEPIWVTKDGGDPDLFFDDDGTAWYTDCRVLGAWSAPIDIATGKLGEMRHSWAGTGGRWPEAPHIYKIDGRYFLLLSEGGTEFGHFVSVARGDSPLGPWEPCPYNPILTHAQRPHAIQATGHADLVQIADGRWWAVFLGIRQQGGPWQHLGRETFLAPVHWTKDGWPIIGGRAELLEDFCAARLARTAMPVRDVKNYDWGCVIPPGAPGTVELDMPAPALPPHPWPEEGQPQCRGTGILPVSGTAVPAVESSKNGSSTGRMPVILTAGTAVPRDDFDSPTLGLQWNFLRNPWDQDWSLTARPGWLRLKGAAVALNDHDSPAWVGRRQQHLNMTATALMFFEPPRTVDEEAGLTVMMNPTHHYDLAVRGNTCRRVLVRRQMGDLCCHSDFELIPAGPVELRIVSTPLEYTFSFRMNGQGESEWQELARCETKYLSAEVAGGFTGVYIAMYATGNGVACSVPADFDYFEYLPGKS